MFINKLTTGMVCAGVAGLAACGAGLVADMLESRERNKEMADIQARLRNATTLDDTNQAFDDIMVWIDKWCRV